MLLIPENLNILEFLNNLHIEDGHRGIKSLRNYILQRGYYIDGSTYLIDKTINYCNICLAKTERIKLKKEPGKQIITHYPRKRFVMDLLELPNDITTDKLYLFCIKDHFSKYGMVWHLL